jgi:hypothetical protein
MPLEIRHRRGLACPIVVCDHCHAVIARAEQGNYQWDQTAKQATIYFTHKRCCAAFEAASPRVDWGAIGLECLPIYLGCNLKVKLRDAKKVAAFCAGYAT